MFGSSVGFKVDNKDSFTSVLGATMSLLIAAVILTYGSGKFIKMYERADTTFQQSIEKINLNHTFGDINFNFYVGFIDHNG